MRKDGGESAREQLMTRTEGGPKGAAKQVGKYGSAKPQSASAGGSFGAALLDAMQKKGQPR